MGTVAGHQLTVFTSPSPGDTPIASGTVKGNDNVIVAGYNAHDADKTIHLQNDALASRPAASTAGQMWLTSDVDSVHLFLDTGAAWVEANYARNVMSNGGTAFRSSALATNATVGFLFIPSSAGAPVGVPADIPTGQVVLHFDSTNNKLYVFDAAWLSTAALT